MSGVAARIKEYVQHRGLSMRAFEKSIGASNGTIANAAKKGTDIGSSFLSKIIEIYPDINATWLLTGNDSLKKEPAPLMTIKKEFSLRTDRKIEIQDIPLYDMNATAGIIGIFNEDNVHPEDYLRIPNLPRVDGAIYVMGESMSPLLKSGDIIIYKKLELSLDSILWGQIYLLSFAAGGDSFTVVKYIQKSDQPRYIRLVSQNERFQPKDIPLASIQALAIVKASITFHTIE